ncbi:putative serine hydrolase FSH, alpha/Beta hydrolase [Dioscorea sansibarensis]
MGSLLEPVKGRRKPRVLCLHGFRTSGEIMEKQLLGKWPPEVTSRFDFCFPDGPWPATGKSEVEALFPPPYYEWYQYNKDFTVYNRLDECLVYIEDLLIKHGPFDGILGFSQGSILAAAVTAMQIKGTSSKKFPKVKFVVTMSGARFTVPEVAERIYPDKITCPSVQFLGDIDFLKGEGELLAQTFVDPVIIHHPKGHTIPRLDEESVKTMLTFIDRVEKLCASSEVQVEEKVELQ